MNYRKGLSAEEEMHREQAADTGSKTEKTADGDSWPGQKENSPDIDNRVQDPGTENVQEERDGEEETGIRVHPQEHREGYREPDLRYAAAAD